MALITAMENISEDGAPVENPDSVVAETKVEVLENDNELGELTGEVESDIADVEDAAVATDELAELGEVVQEGIDSGDGISEETAKAITIAAESICNRLGYRGDAKRCGIRASESFAQPGSRLTYSKMAAESISERVGDIWKNVKAMAARIWEKIVEVWNRFFNSAESQIKHLDALEEKRKKIDADYTMAEDTLKSSSLAKAITFDKAANLDSYVKLVSNAHSLAKTSAGICEIAAAAVSKLGEKAGSGLKLDEAKNIIMAEHEAIIKAMKAVGENNSPGVKNKEKSEFFGKFVNGWTVQFKEVDSDARIVNRTFEIGFAKANEKDFYAESAKALTNREIENVINQAKGLAKKLDEASASRKAAQTVLKNIEKLADSLISLAGKNASAEADKSETKGLVTSLRRAVTGQFQVINTFTMKSPGLMLETVTAGANYASASISNFVKK